jgi:4-diphosphocytidyl-2-C-methyl-D-erythritol kinase
VTETVELAAHAKLNLFLRVLAREADGFHGIETLFSLITLSDTLQARRTRGRTVSLTVSGAECGPPERNLAFRAAELVLEATGWRFGVELTLTKRIPVRGGLGGGSSDAAAALLAVNHLAENAVPRHELLQFAARLGSDIPFFLSGGSFALAWGHGERLLRLPAPPAAPALLVVPAIGIATPDAYAQVDAARQGIGRRGAVALDLDALATWGSIARLAGNDFEFALFGRYPELRRAFEALAATQPVLSRMTGSGSTLFAIYRTARERDDAQLTLSRKLGDILPTETLPAPVPGPEPVH